MADERNDSTTSEWSNEATAVKSLELREDFPLPSLDEWREVVEKDLKGAPYDKKLLWKTPEGITVKPLYSAKDLEELEHLDQLPGFAPFGRGEYPLSGIAPPWQIRQDSVLASPEDVNASLRDGLARGQTALGFRLDNAARRGLDGDDAQAKELAGRGGCTISSINGLRIALQDIDISRFPLTIRSGASALPILAMLVALADERGVKRDLLIGAVECDPIRELVRYGKLHAPLKVLFREMADMAKYCASNCPGIRSVLVNSSPWHNTGGSIVQELGYTIATGIEYMRQMIDRGVSPDEAAQGISFSFSVTTNLFLEIAKLRAARMLWAKVVKAFGAKNEESWKMFMHVRTSTWDKTVHDPYNNMIRSTIEAFAGATGGCSSMYVAPFDETIGRPDEFSMRIARNQQLILCAESAMDKVVDPAGGSYYVESLTDSIGREAWKLVQEVEGRGGIIEDLKDGTIHHAISETATHKRQKISQRRESIVGVSNYANPKEKLPPKRHIPREDFLAKRRERLARLKSVRRNSRVRDLLAAVTQAVYTDEGNLLELTIEAASEGATIGEITRAVAKGADEEHLIIKTMRSGRASIPFEELRDRCARYAKAKGNMPKAFLVTMGPLGMRRARADFSHGFLGAAGIDVEESAAGFDNIDAAVKAAIDSGSGIAVLCSDDPSYSEIVPPFTQKAKALKRDMLVYVAGYPQETIAQLKQAGVDGFIHIRADAVPTLTEILDKLNVR